MASLLGAPHADGLSVLAQVYNEEDELEVEQPQQEEDGRVAGEEPGGGAFAHLQTILELDAEAALASRDRAAVAKSLGVMAPVEAPRPVWPKQPAGEADTLVSSSEESSSESSEENEDDGGADQGCEPSAVCPAVGEEEDEDESAAASARQPPRTKNEISEYELPLPEVPSCLAPDEPIEKVAVVSSVLDRLVVFKAMAGLPPLSEGSLLCIPSTAHASDERPPSPHATQEASPRSSLPAEVARDVVSSVTVTPCANAPISAGPDAADSAALHHTPMQLSATSTSAQAKGAPSPLVIGRVSEIFGAVTAPFYSVRFASNEDIARLGLVPGVFGYVATAHSTFLAASALRSDKGTDASGADDEELPAEEQEFSDDEAEAEAKRKRKLIATCGGAEGINSSGVSTRQRGTSRGCGRGGREGRGKAHAGGGKGGHVKPMDGAVGPRPPHPRRIRCQPKSLGPPWFRPRHPFHYFHTGLLPTFSSHHCMPCHTT